MGLKKNWVQIFRFSSFRLWSFYPTGINIGSKRPQLLLKHAEKQSGTRRVQSFGAKSGASAAKLHASGGLCAKNFAHKEPALVGPQPSSLKIDLKALMLLFRKLYKLFVGLE